MSRRKTWDVEDTRRLQRSIQANDQFVDDLYYYRSVSPHEFAIGGTTSHVIVEEFFSGIEFGFAGPGDSAASLDWPLWWRYGRVTAKACMYHTSGVGSSVVFRLALYARQCGGTTVVQLIDDTSAYATTATGAAQAFSFEVTSDIIQRGDYDILGLMVDRRPTDPNDNVNAAMTLLECELTWKPEPR